MSRPAPSRARGSMRADGLGRRNTSTSFAWGARCLPDPVGSSSRAASARLGLAAAAPPRAPCVAAGSPCSRSPAGVQPGGPTSAQQTRHERAAAWAPATSFPAAPAQQQQQRHGADDDDGGPRLARVPRLLGPFRPARAGPGPASPPRVVWPAQAPASRRGLAATTRAGAGTGSRRRGGNDGAEREQRPAGARRAARRPPRRPTRPAPRSSGDNSRAPGRDRDGAGRLTSRYGSNNSNSSMAGGTHAHTHGHVRRPSAPVEPQRRK